MDCAVYLPDCMPSASSLMVISSSSNALTGAGFEEGASDCAVSASARLPSALTPRNVLRFIRFPFEGGSQARMPILLTGRNAHFTSKQSTGKHAYSTCLVSQEPFGGVCDVIDLRQDGILQPRMISHPGIERTDAAHWSVEAIEQLVGDACGNLGTVAPGHAVLMCHEHAAGFFH